MPKNSKESSRSIPFSHVIDEVARADPSNIQQVAATQMALSNDYYRSVLKQAGRSFTVAIGSTVIGLAFFIGAVSFSVFEGDWSASVTSSIAGGIVEVIAGLNFWLYGRTSLQLEAFHVRLERTQRYLLANSVARGLPMDERGAAVADLVKSMVQSSGEGSKL